MTVPTQSPPGLKGSFVLGLSIVVVVGAMALVFMSERKKR